MLITESKFNHADYSYVEDNFVAANYTEKELRRCLTELKISEYKIIHAPTYDSALGECLNADVIIIELRKLKLMKKHSKNHFRQILFYQILILKILMEEWVTLLQNIFL